MADKIAAGELPLWVRFAVRRGSRRKTALSQTIILATTGFLSVIAGANLATAGAETEKESVLRSAASALGWLGLFGGLAMAAGGLLAWFAIRWVDRKDMWVELAEPRD